MTRSSMLKLVALGIMFLGSRLARGDQFFIDVQGFVDNGGTFTDITDPVAVSLSTVPIAINSRGQIAGFFLNPSGGGFGFVDTNGSFTTIDVPGSQNTQALGINDQGQVVGVFVDADGVQHGFLDNGGNFTAITFPGALATYADAITNTGQILGNYYDGRTIQSFTYQDGKVIPLQPANQGFLAGTLTATGINDSGQIVGFGLISGFPLIAGFACRSRGFSGTAASIAALNDAIATNTCPTGINDRGQIVGTWDAEGGFVTGSFLDTSGSFTPISAPNSLRTLAAGISNSGLIVGIYDPAPPSSVPEPRMLPVLAVMLAGLFALVYGRKLVAMRR